MVGARGRPTHDAARVKKANPASWITTQALREQREAVAEVAYRRYHCNQWTAQVGAWLPAGAWQACAGEAEFTPGERIWVGVDVGGERSASAVVYVNEDLHVGVETWTGDAAVLEVAAYVASSPSASTIVEAVFDPWRAGQMAQEWEQRGIPAVAFPQSDARMIPACERLYDAIVHGRLVHPDDPDLNRHVHAAVARHSRRGWRLDKPDRSTNIDAAVALAMAVERHAYQPATRGADRVGLTRHCLGCPITRTGSYCRRCCTTLRASVQLGAERPSSATTVSPDPRACLRPHRRPTAVHLRIPSSTAAPRTASTPLAVVPPFDDKTRILLQAGRVPRHRAAQKRLNGKPSGVGVGHFLLLLLAHLEQPPQAPAGRNPVAGDRVGVREAVSADAPSPSAVVGDTAFVCPSHRPHRCSSVSSLSFRSRLSSAACSALISVPASTYSSSHSRSPWLSWPSAP